MRKHIRDRIDDMRKLHPPKKRKSKQGISRRTAAKSPEHNNGEHQ